MNILGVHGEAGAGKDEIAKVLVKDGWVRVALADPLKRMARDLWGMSPESLWGPSEARNVPDERWQKDHVWGPMISGLVSCRRCGMFVSAVYEEGAGTVGRTDKSCVALSPREALQLLGTEVGRLIHQDTWARYLIRVAEWLLSQPGGVYEPRVGPARETTFSENGALKLKSEARVRGIVVPDVRYLNEVDAIVQAGGRVWKVTRPGSGLKGVAGQHTSETAMSKWTGYAATIDNSGTLDDLAVAVRKAIQ